VILHLVNGEFYAGAERIQVALGKGLKACGFDVRYICLKDGLFAARVQEMGFEVCTMEMKTRFDLRVLPRITRYIRESGISLVHTHSVRSNMIGRLAGRLAGVPVISHVHSDITRESPSSFKNRLNSIVDRSTSIWTNTYIVVSDNLRDEYLKRGTDERKIVVIKNGICPEMFGESTLRDIRDTYGIGDDEMVAAVIALFRPVKGVEISLRAMADVRTVFPSSRLLLIGPWEDELYRHEMNRLIDDLDLGEHVVMTGFQEDVQGFLSEIDVLVLPSPRTEGLPMVALEAMAMGKPVVAASVGGIPEVVSHGQTGLLVEPGDHRSLARAMLDLFRDPEVAGTLGEAGKETVVQQFNETVMMDRMIDVYESVLGQ
jgi:glycosyltransferase involved in cell wall biosynthesis